MKSQTLGVEYPIEGGITWQSEKTVLVNFSRV